MAHWGIIYTLSMPIYSTALHVHIAWLINEQLEYFIL